MERLTKQAAASSVEKCRKILENAYDATFPRKSKYRGLTKPATELTRLRSAEVDMEERTRLVYLENKKKP